MINYYFSVITIINNNLFTIFPVNEVPRPDHRLHCMEVPYGSPFLSP